MTKIDTRCIHAGYTPGKGEPRQIPIIQSTTFKYETSDQMGRLFDLEDSGYFYSRLQNPTVDKVAARLADLEGGVGAILTSSGQAANLFACINIAKAGDHIVAANNIYGGTFNLLGVTLKQLGIETTFISESSTDDEIRAAIRPETKLIFGETISNPGVEVLDIERWAAVAHEAGIPLVIDNTFATPIHCRPFEWGADIVTHSTTKYIAGRVAGRIVGGKFTLDGEVYTLPLNNGPNHLHGGPKGFSNQVCGLEPGEFVHTTGDTHIYQNHFEQVALQLSREPRSLPVMRLNPDVKSVFDFKYEDFTLEGYDPWPGIKAPVAV